MSESAEWLVGGSAPATWPMAGARSERLAGLVAMAADLAFETDAAGSLVFVAPDRVLGWAAADLLGRPAAALRTHMDDDADPFAIGAAFDRRAVRLRQANGAAVCLSMTATPVMAGGLRTGMRGVAHIVRPADHRGEVLERILSDMRQEVLAPRMMQVVLEGLMAALGAEGAAVLDLLAAPDADPVLHYAGDKPDNLLSGLLPVLADEAADPVIAVVAGRPVLACPSFTRFGDRAGLYAWGAAGMAGWAAGDAQLASAVAAIMRVALEHEAIQRELARQARTDPLTGLLNRRAFLEEVGRRIDRLQREQLPGTLVVVDLDNFKAVNDGCGHDVGDQALVQAARLLRNAVRPADLVARLGGDEFAMWLDASDELTAAERAERLRLDAPGLFAAALPPGAPALSTSIGIASRHPRAAEALDEVMRRADTAMYEVKRAGRAHWRVARDPWLT